MATVTDSIMLTTPKAFSPVCYMNPLKRGLSTPVCPQPSRQLKGVDMSLSDYVQRAQFSNFTVASGNENGLRRISPEKPVMPSSFASAAQQWAQKCASNKAQPNLQPNLQPSSQTSAVNQAMTPANSTPSPMSRLFSESDKAGIIGLLNDFSSTKPKDSAQTVRPGQANQGGFTPHPFTPVIFHAQTNTQSPEWPQLGVDYRVTENDADSLKLYSSYDYWSDSVDPVLYDTRGGQSTQLEVDAVPSEASSTDVPFELEAMTLSNVEVSPQKRASPGVPPSSPQFYIFVESPYSNFGSKRRSQANSKASSNNDSGVHVASQAPSTKPRVCEVEEAAISREESRVPVNHVGPLCSCDERCGVDHGLRKQRYEIDNACKQLGLREVRLSRHLYECPSCKQTFKSSTVARRHVTTHYDTRPYYCIYCLGKFSRDDAVLRHVHTRCQSYAKRDKPRRKSAVEVKISKASGSKYTR